jgi:hypothetical protein
MCRDRYTINQSDEHPVWKPFCLKPSMAVVAMTSKRRFSYVIQDP